MTELSAKNFVAMLITKGHDAMLEHLQGISMKFICDRGVSHEIVRHRLFSFAQESTRYCNYSGKDIVYILPCWFTEETGKTLTDEFNQRYLNNDDYYDDHITVANANEHYWCEAMMAAEIFYNNLINLGWSPQQARSVLPNSLKTEIVVTGNLREWRHFFKLRTDKAAHPQMQEVANMALDILREQIPVVWEDI